MKVDPNVDVEGEGLEKLKEGGEAVEPPKEDPKLGAVKPVVAAPVLNEVEKELAPKFEVVAGLLNEKAGSPLPNEAAAGLELSMVDEGKLGAVEEPKPRVVVDAPKLGVVEAPNPRVVDVPKPGVVVDVAKPVVVVDAPKLVVVAPKLKLGAVVDESKVVVPKLEVDESKLVDPKVEVEPKLDVVDPKLEPKLVVEVAGEVKEKLGTELEVSVFVVDEEKKSVFAPPGALKLKAGVEDEGSAGVVNPNPAPGVLPNNDPFLSSGSSNLNSGIAEGVVKVDAGFASSSLQEEWSKSSRLFSHTGQTFSPPLSAAAVSVCAVSSSWHAEWSKSSMLFWHTGQSTSAEGAAAGGGEGVFVPNEPVSTKGVVGKEKEVVLVSKFFGGAVSLAGDSVALFFLLLEPSWGELVSGSLKVEGVFAGGLKEKEDSGKVPKENELGTFTALREGSGVGNMAAKGDSGILGVGSGALGVALDDSNVEDFPKSRRLLGKGTVSKSWSSAVPLLASFSSCVSTFFSSFSTCFSSSFLPTFFSSLDSFSCEDLESSSLSSSLLRFAWRRFRSLRLLRRSLSSSLLSLSESSETDRPRWCRLIPGVLKPRASGCNMLVEGVLITCGTHTTCCCGSEKS